MEELIKKLIIDGVLKTPRLIGAFYRIGRQDFLLAEYRDQAAADHPLPTSHGQTISQPWTVAFMLELLQPGQGEKILDVGSGSGWQTALLAELVGPDGKVTAIERIPDLSRFGQANAGKYNFNNIEFICGDGTRGYKRSAPYDKIIVAAAAEIGIPDILLQQLKVGGRLVIPVGKYEQEMVMVDKISDNDFREKKFPGFQFVPLVPSKWGE